jgi:hypothetical protein
MSKRDTPAARVGRAVAVLIPLALMLWAAATTEILALRITLLLWVLLVAVSNLMIAAGWRPKAETFIETEE